MTEHHYPDAEQRMQDLAKTVEAEINRVYPDGVPVSDVASVLISCAADYIARAPKLEDRTLLMAQCSMTLRQLVALLPALGADATLPAGSTPGEFLQFMVDIEPLLLAAEMPAVGTILLSITPDHHGGADTSVQAYNAKPLTLLLSCRSLLVHLISITENLQMRNALTAIERRLVQLITPKKDGRPPLILAGTKH